LISYKYIQELPRFIIVKVKQPNII